MQNLIPANYSFPTMTSLEMVDWREAFAVEIDPVLEAA